MAGVLVPLFSAAVRSGGSWRVVVGRGNAGAAHGHRHVLLSIHGAAPRTACSAAQHYRGQQHGCTAEAEILLPAWPGQAASAQAVGLRQEPRVAGGVVGQPAGRGGISASLGVPLGSVPVFAHQVRMPAHGVSSRHCAVNCAWGLSANSGGGSATC